MAATSPLDEPLAAPALDPAWWARQLSLSFRRVVVFVLEGKVARAVAEVGAGPDALGVAISLREQTPLRWTLEAASPLVLFGGAPGGEILPQRLGLTRPRALAIVPLVSGKRVVGFAYADAAEEALALPRVSEVFASCYRALSGAADMSPRPGRTGGAARTRRGPARVARRQGPELRALPRQVELEPLEVVPEAQPLAPAAQELVPEPALLAPEPSVLTPEHSAPPVAPPPVVVAAEVPRPPPLRRRPPDNEAAEIESFSALVASSLQELDTPEESRVEDVGIWPPEIELEVPAPLAQRPSTSAAPSAPAPALALAQAPESPTPTEVGVPTEADAIGVVTPAGVVPLSELGRRRPRLRRALALAVAACLVAASGAALNATAPAQDRLGSARLTIPPQTSVAAIAEQLEKSQLVRSAAAFRLMARVSGLDRTLRAGVYELPLDAWAWEILSELERGQVHHVQVTVPEGLSLREVARLLEHHDVASTGEIMRAAKDPELLAKFDIRGKSVEGFLFPETYTFARGLSAREVVESMVELFFVKTSLLPEAVHATPEQLYEKIALAAIIEKEARDKSEQAKIAGVFKNRLEQNMKLESCATVQYVLGRTKERLTLADVRQPSPYNTYLHTGLPPGPIANPGLGAIKAAFRPEKHDYMFFFAREDGSHQHVFTKTYAEHMKAQRLLARN